MRSNPSEKGSMSIRLDSKITGNAFIAVAGLGALFLLTELVFQSFGKSICQTEGCGIVSRHSRFGDGSLILIGLATLSTLAFLSFSALYRNRSRYEKYINLVLVVSLAAEGFLVGYQIFRIQTLCLICLITFGIFLVLGALRLLYGEKDVIAGFLSTAAIFALFYLILPAGGGKVNLPEAELILFDSKACKYCAEVTEKIKANKLNVTFLSAGEYSGFLKNTGIEHVPTLFVNRKNQKIFITGKDAIDHYLFYKPEASVRKKPAPAPVPELKKKALPKQSAAPVDRQVTEKEPAPFLILNNSASDFLLQTNDDGMCPETVTKEEDCDWTPETKR
jgi:hypothetical protein